MTLVKKTRSVPFSCQQMYDLVNDVECYPEFLPYCVGSSVHFRNENEIQATLTIGAKGMQKSFTTHNLLQPNKIIEIRLVDGPFHHLEGFWRFEQENDGCQIYFDLEFEFSNRFFSTFLGPIFEQITNKMVEAFCERAEHLYGEN